MDSFNKDLLSTCDGECSLKEVTHAKGQQSDMYMAHFIYTIRGRGGSDIEAHTGRTWRINQAEWGWGGVGEVGIEQLKAKEGSRHSGAVIRGSEMLGHQVTRASVEASEMGRRHRTKSHHSHYRGWLFILGAVKILKGRAFHIIGSQHLLKSLSWVSTSITFAIKEIKIE